MTSLTYVALWHSAKHTKSPFSFQLSRSLANLEKINGQHGSFSYETFEMKNSQVPKLNSRENLLFLGNHWGWQIPQLTWNPTLSSRVSKNQTNNLPWGSSLGWVPAPVLALIALNQCFDSQCIKLDMDLQLHFRRSVYYPAEAGLHISTIQKYTTATIFVSNFFHGHLIRSPIVFTDCKLVFA